MTAQWESWRYTLTPASRVTAGRGREVGFVQRMHEVLRGGTVRGALGTAWWNPLDPGYDDVPEDDRQRVFDEVFDGALEIRQALPHRDGRPPELAAASWVRPKYPDPAEASGQAPSWHDEALHGAPSATGPDASGGLERGKGWRVPEDWQLRSTSTSLDPDGTAKEKHLYSRISFRRGIVFSGTLRLDRSLAVSETAAAWLGRERRISVGGRRSLLGRVAWSAEPVASEAVAPEGPRIVLRLLSPAILVDRLGAPCTDLAGWLRERPGAGRVDRAWSRPLTESGWNGIAGIPKPSEWLVEAGGTAVLHDWPREALAALADGIGLRRNEGFGEVRLIEAPPSEARQRGAEA